MNIAMPLRAAGVLLLALTLPFFADDEPHLKPRPPLPPNGSAGYRLASGQRIPIKFLNTVTTRGQEGDRVFLQTVFPVSAANRIVIPARSFIDGEVTSIRRADRATGRAELAIRLGMLTLPNGSQRQLRIDAGAAPSGIIAATCIIRGGEVILAPGTTADIVLVDTILFPVEEIVQRRP